jgi:5-bromo-4-chloroindolyl phosphate hydrolysis protein
MLGEKLSNSLFTALDQLVTTTDAFVIDPTDDGKRSKVKSALDHARVVLKDHERLLRKQPRGGTGSDEPYG